MIMETRKIKCSDIPDSNVLEILNKTQGKWTSLWNSDLGEYFSQYPPKIAFAKMRQLYKKGFTGGCPCGCRGDFEITDKGLDFINKPRTKEYTGY